jgi:hypothetical protein
MKIILQNPNYLFLFTKKKNTFIFELYPLWLSHGSIAPFGDSDSTKKKRMV